MGNNMGNVNFSIFSISLLHSIESIIKVSSIEIISCKRVVMLSNNKILFDDNIFYIYIIWKWWLNEANESEMGHEEHKSTFFSINSTGLLEKIFVITIKSF